MTQHQHEQDLLLTRCAQIPQGFAAVEEASMPDVAWQTWRHKRIALTGIGMSEGVARMAAVLWARAGLRARFVPVSMCLNVQPDMLADVLVVISQGLSSNMRLAMEVATSFEDGLLLTSLSADDPCLASWPFDVMSIPPEEECCLLLRIQGPIWASYGVMRLTRQLHDSLPESLPSFEWVDAQTLATTYQRILDEASESSNPMAQIVNDRTCMMLSIGVEVEMLHGARWKMLEGLWINIPPIVDILQFIHGPWQGSFHHRQHMLVCHHGQPYELQLIERLRALLQPGHTLTLIESSWSSPWDVFCIDAQLNAWVCAQARAGAMAPGDWPGYKADGALYDLQSRTDLGLNSFDSDCHD